MAIVESAQREASTNPDSDANDASSADSSANPTAYIAALMSNVLRVNSAWDHSRIAAATHAIMLTGKPQALRESASAHEIREAGTSD